MKETHMTTNNTRKFVLSLLDELDMNIMRLKTEMDGMTLQQIAIDTSAMTTIVHACTKACLKANEKTMEA